MRGNPEVIAQLNVALREELTAINQYFLHAEMCHSWGYHQLGAYIKKQSIDEMKHAEKLIERLLFLDATPKMEYLELNVGGNVKSQLEADLKLEVNAVEMYNKVIGNREPGSASRRKGGLRPSPSPIAVWIFRVPSPACPPEPWQRWKPRVYSFPAVWFDR